MKVLYLTLSLVLATTLFACQKTNAPAPEARLAEIQSVLGAGLDMTSVQRDGVNRLVAEGKTALEAGRLDDAQAAFDEAVAILKRAQEADTFNKAE